MTENERKTIMSLADIIKGEVNRMCVTNQLSELDTMHKYAKVNIEKLLKLVYDAKFSSRRENA